MQLERPLNKALCLSKHNLNNQPINQFTMKNLITIVCLCVGFAMSAQVVNITYVSVDRENSETFLELHEKFTNLSISEDRTIVGGGMFFFFSHIKTDFIKLEYCFSLHQPLTG